MSETKIPDDPRDMHDAPPVCKYCQQPMKKMKLPTLANFDSPWMYICFSDDCGYFQRGWEVMMKQNASNSSYRYKVDPFTGETGPFPVWSAEAMRDLIIEDNE